MRSAADMEQQLGQDIPQEIRNDPERCEAFVRMHVHAYVLAHVHTCIHACMHAYRYEAFVQQKLAEQLAKPDTDLARRAESLFSR